jgi:hypothetical protein
VVQTNQVYLLGLHYISRRSKKIHVARDPKELTALISIRGYDDLLNPLLEIHLESFGGAEQQLFQLAHLFVDELPYLFKRYFRLGNSCLRIVLRGFGCGQWKLLNEELLCGQHQRSFLTLHIFAS